MARARSVVLPSLFYWRTQRDVTQERLAERIAMRRTTIWRIETGRACRPRTARLLAGALNVQVADLMDKPPES